MIGQQFGHYKVESRLGSGGVGEVYLARDLRLDRRVAIKILNERRVADERARARFRREAQALSRLNHPNIATIFDFDQQDGRDFLVMEYIDGMALRDVGTDGILPADVVRLGTQLAEALVAAHGAGVVHLDLKPGNLMLTPDGRLKVLDFGIARLQTPDDASTGTDGYETGTAANAAGTPPYMAPEQVAAGPVDARTDIYAAGATLYELATGRRVFDKPRGIGLYEAILRDRPVAPSHYTPEFPGPLEDVLLKALEKQPEKRHQTAHELLDDFRSCPTSFDVRGFRRGRRWTRRALTATGAAVVLAAISLGYALGPVPARPKFNARDFVVVADLENRTSDPLLSRTVQEALTIALQQSHYVNIVSHERVAETLKLMQKPAAPVTAAIAFDICRREGVAAFLSGSVARSGEITQIKVTASAVTPEGPTLLFTDTVEYRKPEDLFAQIDDLARQVRQNLGETLAGIATSSKPLDRVTTGSLEALRQYSVAVAARATGNINGIEGPLLAALQLDPDFAMAHLRLGSYYLEIAGNTPKAFSAIDLAYGLRDRVTDREKHFISAEYFAAHQRFEAARESLKALTTLYPDDPDFRYELGLAHFALDELTPAITHLRQAIRLSPHGARAQGTLVLLLARNNQPQEALAASVEAQKAGVESPYLYWARGLAQAGNGDLPGARRDFEKLSQTPGYYTHLGGLQAARLRLFEGSLDLAIADLARVAEMTRREGDTSLELVARIQLARAAIVKGDLRLARDEFASVIRLTAPETTRPNAIRDAGSLALEVGDLASARASLKRLGRLGTSAPNAVMDAAQLFLAGDVARYERHYGEAERLLDESYVRWPFYGCTRATAQAREALGDWAGAAAAWTAVLAAKGQILQEGFAPDLELAREGLKRASGHLKRKDK
ncbi:MAG TPA: protein kinase [Vicinamibacterales bacterium]|nr:protein kinase [Vicinamibacterales bacterium]